MTINIDYPNTGITAARTDVMLQTNTVTLTSVGTVSTIGDVINGMNGNWVIDNWPVTYPTIYQFPHAYGCCCTQCQPFGCCGLHCHNSTCTACVLAIAAALAALKPAATVAAPQPAPVVTPGASLADTLAQQARARIDEIQKRLDEVPALTAELERLQRMVDAGGK